MLEENDFLKWAESFYYIGYIFEGRHDVYPNCRKWVDEWYTNGSFMIDKDDLDKLEKNLSNHNYDAFRSSDKKKREKYDDSYWEKIKIESDSKIRNLVSHYLFNGYCDNIGIGLAPYLFTWNYQRFKEYIKRKINSKNGFDLDTYFVNLGKCLDQLKKDFYYFKEKKFYLESIEEDKIRELYNKIHEKLKELGIGNNEPVGTAKILHMMAPYYFPLIDNDIAKNVGLKIKGVTLNINKYITWIRHLKSCLARYNQTRLDGFEKEMGLSILKLIDGGLYVMCSINLSKRVDKVGFNLPD